MHDQGIAAIVPVIHFTVPFIAHISTKKMVRRVSFCPSVVESSSLSARERIRDMPPRAKVDQQPADSMSTTRRCRRRQRCRRRATTTANAAGLPPFTTLLLFIHVAIFAAMSFVPAGAGSSFGLFCDAKEIVATNEWQKLGENDTIPAGLHVKMDITTGEKWAKLPSDEDEEAEEAIKGAVYDASINADGSVTATAVAAIPQNDENNNGENNNAAAKEETQAQPHTSEPDYDYEMMHRTLSKLPDDEMERYGGLPALPSSTGGYKSLTAKEREAFEERMAAIWKQRQEEIQNMQEEFMADMPKMLLQRIRYVQSYLENPQEHRTELAEERRLKEEQDDANIEEEEEDVVSNIVEVLNDVEYHVGDVDHARDFHTLGGWPVLVSLLTDAVHVSSNDDADNSTTSVSDIDRGIIDEIQAAAAWVIGTAVKNHDEFHAWALEDLRTAFDPTPEQPITVISLLLANLEAYAADAPEPLSSASQSKRQRCLYALGSLIRGNPVATKHFQDLGGPSTLASSLIQSTKISPDRDTPSPSNAKFASKVLGLGGDLLEDVLVNGNGESDDRRGLIDSLTTDSWCHSAVGLVSKGTSLQTRERSLIAMKLMAPYCNFNEEDRKAVQQIGAELHSDGESELSSLEPEIKAEFVQLVDAILKEMDAHQ